MKSLHLEREKLYAVDLYDYLLCSSQKCQNCYHPYRLRYECCSPPLNNLSEDLWYQYVDENYMVKLYPVLLSVMRAEIFLC